jgi:hypothetical protein
MFFAVMVSTFFHVDLFGKGGVDLMLMKKRIMVMRGYIELSQKSKKDSGCAV